MYALSDAPDAPRILARLDLRRRNTVPSLWGSDIPLTPQQYAPEPFNIYKAILRHQNLFFQFAIRLPYKTIIDLYAIDKEFHYRLNQYSVSIIHDYAKYHMPLASFIFSWILYPNLCISDPMLRPMDNRTWLARDVPGFRWVGMVHRRNGIVRDILTVLALEGHHMPNGTAAAMMKFWLLMETNTTLVRLAYLKDTQIWSDKEIALMHLLMVKLDMRFGNAIICNGFCNLTPLLLSQKSLAPLWRTLTSQEYLDEDAAIAMLVRTYLPQQLDQQNNDWLVQPAVTGVPVAELGLLSRERWVLSGPPMLTPIALLATEANRRGLRLERYLMDFGLYGYVDLANEKNIAHPVFIRDSKKVHCQDPYPTPSAVDRVRAQVQRRFASKRGPPGTF